MDLSLKNKEWKEFFINEIFYIKSGKRLTKKDLIKGNKPFIGATDKNNGITAFVSNINNSEDKNVLGVNYNGSVVENFYHPYKAIFSDDVKRLSFKEIKGNKYQYLFVKTIILKQKIKYQYGYKFNAKRMAKQKIMFPVNREKKPDYDFMEAYMRNKVQKKINTYKNYIISRMEKLENTKSILPLKEKKWKEFFINEIFEQIQRGKRLKKSDHIPGKIPYVSSTAFNNGIDDFIGNKNNVRIFSNCISIANSGSVGASFYHPYNFIASDHVRNKIRKQKFQQTYLSIFINHNKKIRRKI